jgi:hypothetical protein
LGNFIMLKTQVVAPLILTVGIAPLTNTQT